MTSGIGIEKKEAQFIAAQDDYSGIMFKALADRLAEATAEWLQAHEIGMSLTENYAMLPTASVSGFYLHQCKYIL